MEIGIYGILKKRQNNKYIISIHFTMKRKFTNDFDKEALDSLKVGECLEAEITFPGEDEPMKMKVCRTKKRLRKK